MLKFLHEQEIIQEKNINQSNVLVHVYRKTGFCICDYVSIIFSRLKVSVKIKE